MNRRGSFYAGIVLMVMGGASVASAQSLSEALGALASKSGAFSDADRQKVGSAIEERLTALASAEKAKARNGIRAEFKQVWAGGSLDFKDAFVGQLAGVLGELVEKSDALASASMMQLLVDTGHEGAVDGLIAGLGSKHAAVRLVAVEGIRSQLGSLGASGLGKVIPALQAVGEKEKSWVVVERVYATLAAMPGSKEVVEAQIKTLEGRVQGYSATRGDWRAEIGVVSYLKEKLGDLKEAERVRVVKALARALSVVVTDYASKVGDEVRMPYDQAAATATLVYSIEDLLTAMEIGGDAKPNLRGALAKRAADAGDALRFELNRWIGTEDVEGALNKAPWNVERGGGSK